MQAKSTFLSKLDSTSEVRPVTTLSRRSRVKTDSARVRLTICRCEVAAIIALTEMGAENTALENDGPNRTGI